MKNLLALIGAAAVTFAGVGWYLGWYEIESLPSPNGKQRLSVDINSQKIVDDVQKGVKKGGEIVSQLSDKKEAPSDKPAPLPTPTGPASSFFAPKEATKQASDAGLFGIRLPRGEQ